MNADLSFSPPVGQAEKLSPGLRRILAPNPSPMTFLGTNTYLIGDRQIAVIDPGPDHAGHLGAILSALHPGQQITHILVTHAHLDHSPLASQLSRETGADVYAYGDAQTGRSAAMQQLTESGLVGGGEGVDAAFEPDKLLEDNAVIEGENWQIRAHWTPGHFGNHLSFALGDMIFTGDLVMGWASSLVSPPDGDLTDFMASCRKLQSLGARVLHSGHGAPIIDPEHRLDWLLNHRTSREKAILSELTHGPATAQELTHRIYTETPHALMPAATRNVLAHLVDLMGKNSVEPVDEFSAKARFRRT